MKNTKDVNVQSFLNVDITNTIQQYIRPDNRCTDFQMRLYQNNVSEK